MSSSIRTIVFLISFVDQVVSTFELQGAPNSCTQLRDEDVQCIRDISRSQLINGLTNEVTLRLEEYGIFYLNTTKQINDSLPCSKLPRDCKDVQRLGYDEDGIYTIHPFFAEKPFTVYCDMYTEGGGWTVIQRRKDGSENFTRNWEDYTNGFGDKNGEFWIGNKWIHLFTEYTAQELRFDLGDWNDNKVYAKYGRFKVASEDDKFKILISSYSGTAGDSMAYSNTQYFTTPDRDQDSMPNRNCGIFYSPGFWFKSCYRANPNGDYQSGGQITDWHGIVWREWKGGGYGLKFTEMKIRPVS